MDTWATPYASAHLQARAARAEIERALEFSGWKWSRRLSVWLDMLSVTEGRGE